jgi:hypothetical protein
MLDAAMLEDIQRLASRMGGLEKLRDAVDALIRDRNS